MTQELKPCPFCGSENVNADFDSKRANALMENSNLFYNGHYIECQDCFGASGYFSTAEMAITAWNTRRTDDQQERIRQLEAERDAAIADMNHIAAKISNCKEFLSGGAEKVSALKLGRCDVCKRTCHEDNPCEFEWRGRKEQNDGNK